jgi:hypothetical protein
MIINAQYSPLFYLLFLYTAQHNPFQEESPMNTQYPYVRRIFYAMINLAKPKPSSRSLRLGKQAQAVNFQACVRQVTFEVQHFPLFSKTLCDIRSLRLIGHKRISPLCYNPEGRGLETRWDHWICFSIYLILPAALSPDVYSASNRNEYLKKEKGSGE